MSRQYDGCVADCKGTAVRANGEPSAMGKLTATFLGSLYASKMNKSSRNLRGKGSKVYADNRGTGLWSKISIRERGGRSATTDTRASSRSEKAGVPISLRSFRDGSYKGSFRSMVARFGAVNEDTNREDSDGRKVRFDINGDYDDEDSFDDSDCGEENENALEARQRRIITADEQDEVAHFSQRGNKMDLIVGRRRVMHPHGRTRAVWDVLSLTLIIWMLITTPFELTFQELSWETRILILRVDYVVDALFMVDIALNFMTAVEYDGKLHFSPRSIAHHYMRGWFAFDVMLTIPLHPLTTRDHVWSPAESGIFGPGLASPSPYAALRLLRLFRVVSVSRIRRRLEFSLLISSTSSSLGGFLLTVLGLSHIFSCTFAYLAFGDDQQLQFALDNHILEDDSLQTKYIAASYWSMMTLATVGYGDVTVNTNLGRLFSILAMAIGGGIFAYGISNVVDLIQQLYIDETSHRQKMDRVNAFMHNRNLPRKLRDEIRANFFHLRKATREDKVQDRIVMQQMSRTMQSRVADLFCAEMMPRRMPVLEGCSAQFIHDIYLAMPVRCYLPGENIIIQDEYGTEMYLLFVGHVQVFLAHTKVATFGPNSSFGEFAIINPTKPRLATIQAIDFCETHTLDREVLLNILVQHPIVIQSIKQLMELRSRKALSLLCDSAIKSRTLIQGLAALWHHEGFQGLLPSGVKVENFPHLHEFLSPISKNGTTVSITRNPSVRTGLTVTSPTSNALNRRRSAMNVKDDAVNTPTQVRINRRKSNVDSAANATTAKGGGGDANTNEDKGGSKPHGMLIKNRSSTQTNFAGSSKKLVQPTATDEHVTTLLAQISALLKRQEALEKEIRASCLPPTHKRNSVISSLSTQTWFAGQANNSESSQETVDPSDPSSINTST